MIKMRTVSIVDDALFIRKTLRKMQKKEDYNVIDEAT